MATKVTWGVKTEQRKYQKVNLKSSHVRQKQGKQYKTGFPIFIFPINFLSPSCFLIHFPTII